MHDVAVIDDPAAAEASLDPIRARLLAGCPGGSASTLASRGLTRRRPTTTCARWSATAWWSSSRSAARATAPSVAPGDRHVLCDLAERPVGGRARSVTRARPALRAGCSRLPGAWSARSATSSPGRARPASRSRPSGSTARCASRPPRTGPRSPQSWPAYQWPRRQVPRRGPRRSHAPLRRRTAPHHHAPKEPQS